MLAIARLSVERDTTRMCMAVLAVHMCKCVASPQGRLVRLVRVHMHVSRPPSITCR